MFVRFFVFILLVDSLFGCSNKVSGEVHLVENVDKVFLTSEADLMDAPKNIGEHSFNSLDEIKEDIFIGMTEEDVLNVFGEDFIETIDAMDGFPVWRYDLNAIEGYQFEAFYDQVDLEGIADEKIDYQVFLIWDEGKVVTYSVFYKVNNNLIEGFYEFENGYSKVDEISIN